MDEFFNGMECKFGVSITDSTMMWILYAAMDKAHEKVQSKEGVIERLNEQSKFCELAIMQLEGCLKFVQEDTDNYILESNHENMLSDLVEIRDRIKGRLEETELAIAEKDRELVERVENELKLRQALELNERELVSLRANLAVERTKSEGVQEFILSNRVSGDESGDGDFCELKNSVDQQVSIIKQKLEDERINLASGMRKMIQGPSSSVNVEPDSELVGEEENRSIDNKEFELFENNKDSELKPLNYSLRPEMHMGSDIDNLKQTLDVAFGRMQNAISLSEMGPMEKQWRCTIEKDTVSILIKGFMRNLRHHFEAEMRKRKNQVSIGLLNEHWSVLINDITSLRFELEPLSSQNEVQERGVEGGDTLARSSCIDVGCKISQKSRGKPLSEVDSYGKSDNSTSNVEEVDIMKGLPEEDPADDGSNFVAKMIKNHESIIRKKSEELNWLKLEIIREKGCSSSRRDNDPDSLKRRIQEVIVRLDNFIEWNSKLGDTFGDYRGLCEEENFPEKMFSNSDTTDKQKMGVDTLADVCEEVVNVSVCCAIDENLHDEIRKLRQERDDSKLQSIIMEETCVILFKGLIKEFHLELCNCDTKSLIKDDICKCFFREMVKEWNLGSESKIFETQIREEVYYTVFSEAVKDLGCTHGFTLVECQEAMAESNLLEDSTYTNRLLHNLESTISVDVCTVFFREMVKEWNKAIESYNTENLVKEEIHRIVFDETVKDIESAANFALSRYQEVRVQDNFLSFPFASELSQSLESLVKEDVYMVFFREMVRSWRMELDAYDIASLIREEIYQFVIVEAVKDAYVSLRESAASNPQNFPEDLLSANKLYKSLEVSGEGNLIQKLDSSLKCFEVEEDLMLSESSEIKEHNVHLDLMGLEHEELDERDDFEWWLTEESTFSSVSDKLEKALQQLIMSKELLRELGSSLGIAVGDIEKVHDQMTPIIGIGHDTGHSFCIPKGNEDMHLNPSDSVFSHLMGFPQVIEEFERMVHDKSGVNILRLEEVNHQLDQLAELVASLRKKELLYRKAFMRKCHNLRLAETEVDLLGDQVDVLLGLLERIYVTLDHYSPVLQRYFGVSDILKLIKKELIGGAAHTHN